jgi:1,4-dihydroxy-2-naphthoyl-CoA hydrolase
MANDFDARYGLEILSAQDGAVTARVVVTDALLDGLGEVPSGLYAALAESIASLGTAFAVMPAGNLAMGLSNDTTRLEHVTAGALQATATAIHRAERAWVWTVRTADDAQRLCAYSRVTVAVRPRPATR